MNALRFAVVTSYAPRHWESHARRCVETFRQFWPAQITLMHYDDQMLYANSEWMLAFKRRHAARPTENYRFDAVRFAHKVAAIELALRSPLTDPHDVLIWMDADCVTHAPVNSEWLTHLLRDADFGYLRRLKKYPECGVMMFRINDNGIGFIDEIVEQYRSDALFQMAEWHDSWVIEQVRQRREAAGRLNCVSLSGIGERTGHPLINGPLGARLDHLKGTQRKAIGQSLRRDIKVPRPEVYWRNIK